MLKKLLSQLLNSRHLPVNNSVKTCYNSINNNINNNYDSNDNNNSHNNNKTVLRDRKPPPTPKTKSDPRFESGLPD